MLNGNDHPFLLCAMLRRFLLMKSSQFQNKSSFAFGCSVEKGSVRVNSQIPVSLVSFYIQFQFLVTYRTPPASVFFIIPNSPYFCKEKSWIYSRLLGAQSNMTRSISRD